MNSNKNFAVIAAINVAALLILIIVPTWFEYRMVKEVGNDFGQTLMQPFIEIEKQSAINQAAAQQQQTQIQAAEQERLAQIAAVKYQAEAEAQRVIAHKASFEKNYQKPAGCDNPKDMSVMIECSNHYMREKKKFNLANGYQ